MSVLLQFARFKSFNIWDVKRNLSSLIYSDYKIVTLGHYIQEEKTKIKPFEYPNDDFKILGVSNKIGLFDNEIKKGKDINQAYKVVKDGFLSYNPYRINVGSIGIKTKKQKNTLISPAYVVFSCSQKLLPEYLFLIFKTDIFNEIIKANTKGSVRQILSYDILESLKIPLPPLEVQKKLVENYHKKLDLANQQLKEIEEKEREIEEYLYKELGIDLPSTKEKEEKNNSLLKFVNFRYLNTWSYNQINLNNNFSSTYMISPFGQMCNFKKKPFNKKQYKSKIFNYVDIASVNPLIGIVKSQEIELNKAPSRATQYINTDDLIIATTRPYLKKFSIVDKKFNNNICSSGFTIIEHNSEKYNLVFIKEFLQSFYGIEQLKEKMTGGLYPAITIKELKAIKIPNPQLNIQNKIANHILNIKADIQNLKQQSIKNKTLALEKFETKVFNEA